VFAGLVLYFAAHGAWEAFYHDTIGQNAAYATRMPLAEYPWAFWHNFAPILVSLWPVYGLAVWGALGPALPRRPGTRFDEDRDSAGLKAAASANPQEVHYTGLLVGWLGFAFLGVSVGGYFRAHYFTQLVPPLALLAGLGATRIPLPRAAVWLSYLVVGFAILWAIVAAPWYYLVGPVDLKCQSLYGQNPFPEAPAVGRFLAEHTSPDEPVFILGSEPEILYYARRRSASRYILMYPLMVPGPDAAARQQAVLDEVRRSQPRFVITVFLFNSFLVSPDTPATLLRGMKQYLADDYAVVGAVIWVDPPGAPALRLRFVTGEAVSETFRKKPMWYDARDDRVVVLVWQRR
jgi:hypothetical protein